MLSVDWGELIRLSVSLPLERHEELSHFLQDLTGGKSRLVQQEGD